MNVPLTILQLLLGTFFVTVGGATAFQRDRALSVMPWLGALPRALVPFIGFSELLGGAGMLLPGMTGLCLLLISVVAFGFGVVMLYAVAIDTIRRWVLEYLRQPPVLIAASVIPFARLFVRG